MTLPPTIQGSMPWRTCGQCIRRTTLRPTPTRFLSTTRHLRSPAAGAAKANPLRAAGSNPGPMREQQFTQYRRSMTLSAAGIAACAVAMFGVIQLDLFGVAPLEQSSEGEAKQPQTQAQTGNSGAMKMDGPDGFTGSPSVIRIQGQDGVEQVETGTSSVPQFPTTIKLPKTLDTRALSPGDEVPAGAGVEEETYQLLGLGIRTVSFLRIQVYVVGMYVAQSDLPELQQRLVRTAVKPPGEPQVIDAPGATSATSLVSTERQQLRELLLDPERGDAAWDAILKTDGLRTAFRIVPTRNTDFMHMRDAWVRGVTGRAQQATAKAREAQKQQQQQQQQQQKALPPSEFDDEAFGVAVNEFKKVFGGGQRKNVPKGQTLLLVRNAQGQLDALFQAEARKPAQFMGRVQDERISRLVWLNYLAGKNVSSEGARQSVVDGVMGIVERPVGTVVQKVV
ncbi:hypothetical protein P170DRAFT_438550 [Aspergillus steynii IBT 23096]|uniref:Chalcone isomerase domain-containing protein n=1 Tax=Aspergillus steynii IBT 23096 TaxID=1392250 RepID=A0A2I2G1U7_9EURO|nr:uncharacterized protein P170DRAFT_438550 [Aspergillus steynii IBT 23096]PLB46846.1 hypothetical protein P170DRAFT_438550 [Aspergillus steynii IBT 23096]